MRLLSLFAIEFVAFLLIIAETFAFFNFVVPLGSIPHSLAEYTVLTFFKLALTLGLGALWFVIMIGLTRIYVRSKVRTLPKPSS